MSYQGKEYPKSRWDDRYTIDPDVDFIRLDMSSSGDAALRAALQADLRKDESDGICNVLYMDEQLAIIRWLDEPFILSITPKGMDAAAPILEALGLEVDA